MHLLCLIHFHFFASYYTQQTENKCLKNVFYSFHEMCPFAFAINLFFEEEQLFLLILFLSKQLVSSKCKSASHKEQDGDPPVISHFCSYSKAKKMLFFLKIGFVSSRIFGAFSIRMHLDRQNIPHSIWFWGNIKKTNYSYFSNSLSGNVKRFSGNSDQTSIMMTSSLKIPLQVTLVFSEECIVIYEA